ncbi:MAG: hypothetical protein J1D77_03125 [Muribaculaceae bacterium]|nr:hypothetical protein [Muribaculaceae bacterium]
MPFILGMSSGAMLFMASSCAAEPDGSKETKLDGDAVETISVSLATRTPSQNIIDENYDYNDFSIEDLIPFETGFDENSIIQVSQQTNFKEPFKFEDDIFDFRFMESEDASWENETSYNFASYHQKIPLEWSHIGAGESHNGGFAMYALYFPVENQLRQRVVDNKVRYSVMQDQSTIENLRKSDIMGAYHSTPAIHTRIQFKMYHLMTYVRIRLYVPLFDEEKNTGYRENALQYATIDNVNNEFSIAWNASISSDTQGPSVDALEGESEIIMYQHPLPEGKTEHPIVSIPYKKFLTPDYYDQGIDGDMDKVRIYDFSVIIPYQYSRYGEDGKLHNFTETDFLNFYFRTNSGATSRYYFNQSFYAINQDGDSEENNESTLEMSQGNFQYLQLYVPRVGNQVVYMGAKINPWTQFGADLILGEDEETD